MNLSTEAIRRRRETLTLTQTECAGRAGMSLQQWHNLESGFTDNPKLETLGKLASALQCSIADLVDEKHPPKRRTGATHSDDR